MLKNYKDLKAWHESYSKGARGQGSKGLNALHLNPRPLQSSWPTKWEKNHNEFVCQSHEKESVDA